ncbi:MAG TPA: HAMP domain-containing sensor histidine kinase, partial [Anaerolineae bacterium]
VPIEVDGQVAGWVLFDEFGDGSPPSPNSPESQFLANVNQATILSALAAAVVALLLGIFLARTIARPVHELTTATQAIAQGELGYQVPIHTQDELGALATSFNQMSTDLARANQLRRQMTADIAHDLRTPTSVIMGYTEALSDGKLPGTPEIYQIMHKEVQHLGHLIEDLRVLSLADAGELPLAPQAVSPLALLEQAAAAHGVQAHKAGIRLTIEAAPDLPSIDVDPGRMAQVLGNLVSNALRHTPAGGQVTLSASQNHGHVLLKVRDTGAGIAAEDLPHIFRRFYRSDKSRSQNGESGLGLAIARSIVEAHGGTIAAESTPGRGTTIIITLPISIIPKSVLNSI